MSASKSKVRTSKSGKSKPDVNIETTEEVKRDREHKIRKFAESPIEVARGAVYTFENNGGYLPNGESVVTAVSLSDMIERSDNLAHAIILAANVGRGEDFTQVYGLERMTAGPLTASDANDVVLAIAEIYKRRMADIPNELPYDDLPGLRDFENNLRFTLIRGDVYQVACLEYCDTRIVWNKQVRLDFAEPDATVVRNQFSTDGMDRHHVMSAYGHLASDEPVCRMVVKSQDMIGNERISARAVLDMIRNDRVSVVGMNPAMTEAFAELNRRILEDEARKAERVEDSFSNARIIGETEPNAKKIIDK